MTIAEWQGRLADHFTVKGVIGGHLSEVFELEDAVGDHLVSTFHGQSVLIDSLQSFFVETLRATYTILGKSGWPSGAANYPVVVAWYAMLFRRYRACELLFIKGYPLDGYALLRDLKDRLFLLAGVVHNMTTFPRILGITDTSIANTEEWKKQSTAARRTEESRIRQRLVGAQSNLSAEVLRELKQWEHLFHDEVHSGRLSLFQEVDSLVRGRAPGIGPTFSQESFAMYMNRADELGWLIARLLPYLQPTPGAFDTDWHTKLAVLDESFRYAVEGLSLLGKKIGEAFITLVDQKFSFRQPLSYTEADGGL